MNEQIAVKRAMERRAMSQGQLAKIMGLTSQSVVAERLRRRSMKVETFIDMMNACGFDVLVRDRNGGKNGVEWVIDKEETVVEPMDTVEPPKKEKKSVTNPETGKIVLSPTEDLIRAGYLTVQQAMERGWKPTPEFLDYILDNEGGNANADA